MHIKVDEDLPVQATKMLRDNGYEASSVSEQNMDGWKDRALWQAVPAHGQFLVTADKGFGDIRAYPPQTHQGVLLLRPDEDGIRPILNLLGQVLGAYRLEMLHGYITVATPRSIRIRRAQIV